MVASSPVSVLIFCIIVQCASGLYFHIAETERKCFIEEIPDETMITGEHGYSVFFLGLHESTVKTAGSGHFQRF